MYSQCPLPSLCVGYPWPGEKFVHDFLFVCTRICLYVHVCICEYMHLLVFVCLYVCVHPLHINFSGYILTLEWPYDQSYPASYMILFLPLIHPVCFYPSRDRNIK